MTTQVNGPFPELLPLPLFEKERAFYGERVGPQLQHGALESLSGLGREVACLVRSHLAARASMVAPNSLRNLSSSHWSLEVPTCSCLCPATRLLPASWPLHVLSHLGTSRSAASPLALLCYLVKWDLEWAGPQQLASPKRESILSVLWKDWC